MATLFLAVTTVTSYANGAKSSQRLKPATSIQLAPRYGNRAIFDHKRLNGGWRIRALSSNPNPEKMSVGLSEDMVSSVERARVYDLNGNAIPLTDLWKGRKAVVGFARHFGCVLCRKRADILASQKARMDAAGVALVLIGPGNVDQAKAFIEQTKFPGEVYADPSHSAFDALKFVSGVFTTFTPSAGLRIINSYIEGYRQDWGLSFQSDTVYRGGWQQGGILVAGPGQNDIIYLHKVADILMKTLTNVKFCKLQGLLGVTKVIIKGVWKMMPSST